jgi:Arc/MetJ family transcription regulator
MRTNIDIDDELMKQARKALGARTKKAAVDVALRKLVECRTREAKRLELVRQRRGSDASTGGDDWLDKWLASGWK